MNRQYFQRKPYIQTMFPGFSTLVCFLVLFVFFPKISFSQDFCSNNKVTNGTFNTNANGWKDENDNIPGGISTSKWYTYSNSLRVSAFGSHSVKTSNLNLCPNIKKKVVFYFWRSWIKAKGSFTVNIGGVDIFTLNLKDGTYSKKLNGAEASNSGDNYSIEVPATTFSNNELKFIYNKINGASASYIVLDNVEVYELKPEKLTPTKTTLEYCAGETANLTEVEPTPIPNGITYEWHNTATNPNDGTKVTDPSEVTAGIYYLYAKNCDDCYSESSDAVTVTENPLPDNIKGGFKAGDVCKGAIGKLTYDARNASFATPHTLTYTDGTNTYTQVISTADATEFDSPYPISQTTNFALLSITDGNGCINTTGITDKTAEFSTIGNIECNITSTDLLLCPNSTLNYSAPQGMDTYAWSVENATINGNADQQTVQVQAGANNTTFTLTLTVGKLGCESTCEKIVTVLDNEPPTFTTPTAKTYCVENIQNATYYNPTTDITPDRPDYYLFVSGNTDLDLDVSTFSDNCCSASEMNISWTITMADGSTINGTGQPSSYGNDVQLVGDGVDFQNKVHAITYKLTDCNGNHTEKAVNITIKPRPKIIKIN